ncbi:MAG: hypothetical protein ACRET9_03160 [Burkholderiales bacterium]
MPETLACLTKAGDGGNTRDSTRTDSIVDMSAPPHNWVQGKINWISKAGHEIFVEVLFVLIVEHCPSRISLSQIPFSRIILE